MNYDLALKLKEAGYPQNKDCDRDICYITYEGNRCWIPTLSELIEQFQARYKNVEGLINDAQFLLRKSVSSSGVIYIASLDGDWESKGTEQKYFFVDPVPEVAVANLWLELNKK